MWDVWAVDVDGLRFVIVAQHFPDAPDEVRRELGEMVDSITFEPEAAS